MAVDGSVGLWQENSGNVYNAREYRRLLERLMGFDVVATPGTAAGGVFRPSDCAVSQRGAGANLSVDVAIGAAYVDGSQSSVQGGYFVFNDAIVNIAISPADPVNPRIDLIGVRVRDTEYTAGSNDTAFIVVQGTPAGVPAEPTVPSNFVTLARVDVAALAASIVNANITDRRRRMSALGGMVVCTSATRPTTNLWEGQAIWETDTDKRQIYDGASWRPVGNIWVCTSSTRPPAPFEGEQIIETDTDRLLVYDGAAWIRTNQYSAAGRTGVTATRATNLNVNNTTVTQVTFTAVTFQSDTFITVTSGVFTIPAGLGGLYSIAFQASLSVNVGTQGEGLITIAGSVSRTYQIGGAGLSVITGSAELPLVAGDTITFSAYQNSGGAGNLNPASAEIWRVAA